MSELLNKISSYNIFNYLLPGVVFVAILKLVSPFDLTQEDMLTGAFFYYFIGLVISRIGSIIIEPILKLIRILEFAPYGDYLLASKKDTLLTTLSEQNNMLRTFCSVFLCIGTIMLYEKLLVSYPFIATYLPEGAIGFLLLLFVLSYKKQTDYIRNRVKKKNEQEG
ncbi:TPA: hypothetical protein ACX6R7_003496 [Photobacterium damselae]